MVVQHNLSAMNANRMLGITSGTLSTSTEKLSSGYKINRAADDTAGLAISEKMRKQIRGLTQASANAEDGVSAVQTAEGALAEVQDMLQRMNELAIKSSNGTNSDTDRDFIQNEIDQLVTEIDRVAQTTKFNETYLLKGDAKLERGYSYSYKVPTTADVQQAAAEFAEDPSTGVKITVAFTAPDGTISNATANDLVKSMRDQGLTVSTSGIKGGTQTSVLELNGDAASNYKVVTKATANEYDITDLEGNVVATVTVNTLGSITSAVTLLATKGTVKAQLSDKELYRFYDKDGNAISANGLDKYFAVSGTGTNAAVKRQAESGKIYDAVGNVISDTDAEKAVAATKDLVAGINVKFQVGADTSSSNKISINIDAMTAKGLGLNGLKVSTTNSADEAVDTIANALTKVSKQRSTLGAIQNRLEHTIKNLDNVVENTTSAESAIRDTDMATEMVRYSNANILAQAGQAMLAQANQANQGVLTLLGG
jgi:flagellin